VQVLPDRVDTTTSEFLANKEHVLGEILELGDLLASTLLGGGEKSVERHRARGKMLARERIELLLDEGSAFLELMPLVGWHSEFTVGASLVTGIGVIEGVEVMVIAHDPTVRGGTLNPHSFKKVFRAMEIAKENRLPIITLVGVRRSRTVPTQAVRGEFREVGIVPRPDRSTPPPGCPPLPSCSATPPPAAPTCPACPTTSSWCVTVPRCFSVGHPW